MNCKNCMQEMEEGAEFCTNCGTPVEKNNATDELELKEFNSEKVQGYFDDIKKVLFNMLLSPLSTVQVIVRSPLKESSFILAGILALIYGLCNMWIIERVYSGLMGRIASFMGFYSSFGMSPEYGSVFAYSFLLFIIALGGLFLGIFLIGNFLFKGEGNTYSAWNLAVISSIPYLASLILGVLLSYLTIYLTLIILIAGIVISLLSLFQGIKTGLNINYDNSAYATTLSIITMNTIVVLALKIFNS